MGTRALGSLPVPPIPPHAHHMVSAGALASGVAALVGALPAISTVLGIIWFLLVFPSTVTDFREWCQKHIRWGSQDEHEEILHLKAEIEMMRAEARSWNLHNKGEAES